MGFVIQIASSHIREIYSFLREMNVIPRVSIILYSYFELLA